MSNFNTGCISTKASITINTEDQQLRDLELQNLQVHVPGQQIKKHKPLNFWKLPTRAGVVLICSALALYAIFTHLISASNIIILPCWRASSCHFSNAYTFTTEICSTNRLQRGGILSSDDRAEARNRHVDIEPMNLQHIVFGIASMAENWKKRQSYIKLWWQPQAGEQKRRGFVWLDEPLSSADVSASNDSMLPDVRISSNASHFPDIHIPRNAVRISRIVSETFRMGLQDVRWFVLGDDDTIFFPQNLVHVLQKYDHRTFHYIGQSTESHAQSVAHSFGMAYGGGGIAISYALAEAIEKMQDDCLWRYPTIYGSDGRLEACAAELGVTLTREPGFHQIDLHGNIYGLLVSHPLAPLVSLHHIDEIEPVFPDRSRLEALQHLMDGAIADQAGILQQSICYDMRHNLTLSVSWGYALQIFDRILTPLELQKPSLTFIDWRTWQGQEDLFTFGVRPLPQDPCQNPSVFFMQSVGRTVDGTMSVGVYQWKSGLKPDHCHRYIKHDTVLVHKQRQDESWFKVPRRQCCEVVAGKEPALFKSHSLTLQVRDCNKDEIIAPT